MSELTHHHYRILKRLLRNEILSEADLRRGLKVDEQLSRTIIRDLLKLELIGPITVVRKRWVEKLTITDEGRAALKAYAE